MGDDEERREIALARREDDVDRRESALADRLEDAEEILKAAELRDVEADIRDDTSAKRDHLADLVAFVHPEGGKSYGSENPARRHAALDRVHAKDDRASAADDRDALTVGVGVGVDPGETTEG